MNLDTSNDYTREKLEQSELGKIVMFYEKNPHDKTSESLSCLGPACWVAAASAAGVAVSLLSSPVCASACCRICIWRCLCVVRDCH
jgi:hypothetical protein